MDNRNVRSGDPIPVSNYSDQPYVVKTDDGGWLMVVTTGAGTEGSKGQHITSAKSFDCGKTWSAPFASNRRKIRNPPMRCSTKRAMAECTAFITIMPRTGGSC